MLLPTDHENQQECAEQTNPERSQVPNTRKGEKPQIEANHASDKVLQGRPGKLIIQAERGGHHLAGEPNERQSKKPDWDATLGSSTTNDHYQPQHDEQHKQTVGPGYWPGRAQDELIN